MEIVPVPGIGEVTAGTDIAGLLHDIELFDGDVVVITSKIVAKAEGRVVLCEREDATARAELIRRHSRRILRQRGSLFITETHAGHICANAGIDWSNSDPDTAVLLPVDADKSAFKVRNNIAGKRNLDIAVVISDTFGRTWRNGAIDIALGSAGLTPIVDHRNQFDAYGNELVSTQICVADEIASAASLVMGKTLQIPVAVVRGIPREYFGDGSVAHDVVRKPGEDLFR